MDETAVSPHFPEFEIVDVVLLPAVGYISIADFLRDVDSFAGHAHHVVDLSDDAEGNEVLDDVREILGLQNDQDVDELCGKTTQKFHNGNHEWENCTSSIKVVTVVLGILHQI